MDQAADAWRWNLDTYAARVSGGQWVPYRWQVHLAAKLAAAVIEGGRRIIVTAPPRHGKSTTIARWLPTWVLDLFPHLRVILGSYSMSLAVDWSEQVRDTFDGSNPHVWTRLNPNHTEKKHWKTTVGEGGMRAIGVDSGVTGFGGDLVIVSDPHKDWFEAQSAARRQHVIDWFQNTLYNRQEPGATFVIDQTRWVVGDLAGYLKDEHPDDWEEIRLPALAEEDDPLGREVGEALCPERYDEAALARLKIGAGQSWWGLYQQRPTSAGGNIVKREWIKYYGGPTGVELPKRFDSIWQSWDLNMGGETTTQKRTGKRSWVVGGCWGSKGGDVYRLDHRRYRGDHVRNKKEVSSFAAAWRLCAKILVEKAASGRSLLADLVSKVPGLIGVDPVGSKAARFEYVAPLFESGCVYVPHPSIAEWVPGWVEEIVTFPKALDDDQVDEASQALADFKANWVEALDIEVDDLARSNEWQM